MKIETYSRMVDGEADLLHKKMSTLRRASRLSAHPAGELYNVASDCPPYTKTSVCEQVSPHGGNRTPAATGRFGGQPRSPLVFARLVCLKMASPKQKGEARRYLARKNLYNFCRHIAKKAAIYTPDPQHIQYTPRSFIFWS